MSDTRRSRERSEPGLDAYRALVVLMMFAVHSRRLQSSFGHGFADRMLSSLMWLEPYIAASFLFIAGFALTLSFEKRRDGWLEKLSLRALGLWFISVVLFVPQYGIELPDLLLSSGILSAIAVSIVLTGIALRGRYFLLALLGVVVITTTAVLDYSGGTVPGLNGGPGGAFPLVAFCALGALVGRARAMRGSHASRICAIVALVATLAAIATRQSFVTERASMYRPHSGELAIASLFASGPKLPVYFWNHSAIGVFGLAFPLVATLYALLAAGPALARSTLARPLLLLGRHALAVYVIHLGLLGLVDLAELAPKSVAGTWLLIAALALAALAFARVLESALFTRASAWLGKRRPTKSGSDTSEPRIHRPQT